MPIATDPTAVSAPQPARHALPDPGEQVPRLAWPTLGMFAFALTLFVAGTWTAIDHSLPRGASIAMNAVACFVMFPVVHDASHYSVSSWRWVHGLFGRDFFGGESPRRPVCVRPGAKTAVKHSTWKMERSRHD